MFRIVVTGHNFFFLSVRASLWASDLHMPGAGDRCPVCGMFVAPYPEWDCYYGSARRDSALF